MIPVTLSFLAGLLLIQYCTALPENHWLIAGTIACNAIIVWRRYWLCLWFSMGLMWAVLFANYKLQQQLPESLQGQTFAISGVVTDLPEQTPEFARFNFNIEQATHQLPNSIRLSWYHPNQLVKSGQHWSFTVKLKRPHGNFNPGGFDYEQWMFVEGIGATGTVRKRPVPVLLRQDSAWQNTSVWRQYIADQLVAVLPNAKYVNIVKALTIGDGSTITAEQWDIFRKTGTTHLFVISGSHIALVAGLVYWLVLRLWARTAVLQWSPQKVAAIIALLSAVAYSALAGFSIPTQRAMVMFAVAMLAVIVQRHYRPLNTLALAMLVILVFDPLAVLAIGFWLSCLAVGLIIYVVSGRLRQPNPVIGMLRINWATSIGLAPLLLIFFQQVSMISPLANFFAVPVVSFLVVPPALVATFLLPVNEYLACKIFWLVDWVLAACMWALTHCADLPFATLNHAPPPLWTLAFAIPSMLWLLAPKGIPARWLGGVMLLPLFYTDQQAINKGEMVMTVLDVGQGLAAVVQTSQHTLVYDTGPKFNSGLDSGQTVVLPFLQNQGIDRVDTVVISHSDNDHSGGAQSLLQSFPNAQVVTSAPELFLNAVLCRAGQSWQWDGVTFTMLAPSQKFEKDNDNSCVLKITSRQGSVLLTGDIEAVAEQQLVQEAGINLKSEIMLAPHHGSKTSSSKEFLQAVAAKTILIPAGYYNQFGHPHRDVMARYQQLNMQTLNTATAGAIRVFPDHHQQFSFSLYRDSHGKYWNNKPYHNPSLNQIDE